MKFKDKYLAVLIFKEGPLWVAMCENFDLVAQGRTVGSCKKNFLHVLRTHLWLIKDAPVKFLSGKRVKKPCKPSTPL